MLRVGSFCASGRPEDVILAGEARREIFEFMGDMQTKKGAWWKDRREVWFGKRVVVQLVHIFVALESYRHQEYTHQ